MITITKKDLLALGNELAQPNVGSLQVSGSLDKLYVEHYSTAGARLGHSFIELTELDADTPATITEAQIDRTQRMMQEIAAQPVGRKEIAAVGGAVRVEAIGGSLYVFGSELDCLRIFAKYNANGAAHSKNARVGYSENLSTHYFVLENALSSNSDGPRKPESERQRHDDGVCVHPAGETCPAQEGIES